MITLEVEKQCGCFKRSEFEAVKTFDNLEVAKVEAQKMCDQMNEEFCFKHNFVPQQDGDKLIIKIKLNEE